jgi:hypothetical protein
MPLWTNGVRKSVPIKDHPGALMMLKFEPPALMLTSEQQHRGGAQLTICPVAPGFVRRVSAQGGSVGLLNPNYPFATNMFARLLAKIAHAHITAELGHGNFIPLLIDFVLNKEDTSIYDFVVNCRAAATGMR